MRNALKILVIVALISTHAVAGINLVANGGFEDPDIPYGGYGIYESIPGWSTSYGFSVEI